VNVMDKHVVEGLIAQGENSSIEFKSDYQIDYMNLRPEEQHNIVTNTDILVEIDEHPSKTY